MRKQFKGFILGVLVSTLFIGFTFSAIAAWQKQATLTYNNIKISLDGTIVTPRDANGNVVEPFIIDGTTYLPVRAVASALGLNVAWDQATATVKLTRPGYVEGSYGRLNPAPVGTPQTFKYSSYSTEYTATVTIKSVLRGDAAWQKISAANGFNDPPADGMEYILAEISLTLLTSKDNKAVSFNEYDFTAFSSDGAEYEQVIIVPPNPDFDGRLFPGGMLTGYAVFQVRKNDPAPRVVIGEDYYGQGGAWFSLVK